MECVADNLVERIKAGDKDAEEALVKNYWRQLYFILYKRSNDPELASDIAQDGFMVVLRKARAGEIENPHALGAFIRQVGVNLLNAHYQQKSRRKTDTDEDMLSTVADQNPDVLRQLSADQLVELVRQVIEELPTERDRDLLYRVFIYGESKPQICDALALTPAHFDRVLHRARSRLRQLLTHKYGEEFHQSYKGHAFSIGVLCLSWLLSEAPHFAHDKNIGEQVRGNSVKENILHIAVKERLKHQLDFEQYQTDSR